MLPRQSTTPHDIIIINPESGQNFCHHHMSQCTWLRRAIDEIYDTHMILEVNSNKTLWMLV
jgi:hypothetical protein